MVSSSKILTVSYGTFSCTLEGFDDSFDTMKAIAEYFRDLAADDRYFGAEPPTPDAEMLARIAEREISRRVEARMDRTGIVLRPADFEEAPAPEPAAQKAAQPAAEPAPVAKAPETAPSDMPAQAEQPDDNAAAFFAQPAESAAPASGESLIERLKRIRAAAAQSALAAETTEEEGALAEPLVAPSAPSEALSVTPQEEPAEEPVLNEVMVEDTFETTTAEPAPSEDDTVTDSATDPEPETIVAEERSLEEIDSADDDADAALIASLSAPVVPEEASAPLVEEASATGSTPNALDLSSFEDTAEDEPEEADVAAPLSASMSFDAFAEDVAARLETTEVSTDEITDDGAQVEISPVAEDHSTDVETVEEEVETVAEGEIVENWFDDADPTAQSDAETDQVNLASLDGLEDYEDSFDDAEEAALSPEEEAELARELAEVSAAEAEVVAASAPDDHAEETDALEIEDEDDATAENRGRDILTRQPNGDGDVERIMSRTDDHLSEPEGERRRAAIAQLRAAVAATEAARQLGDKPEDADAAQEPFRADLKKAVKPRSASGLLKAIRGNREKPTTPRPERPRPAPLRLVAEQRVDEQAGSDGTPAPRPVRPTRPAASARAKATPVISGYDSFSEFADSMGAHGLGDLLEAAAAYTAFVEGAEDFSRPELIQKVREVHSEDFSREDGLRFFGTLLREGRINKVSAGRFQVADSTRFRPTQRAAGH